MCSADPGARAVLVTRPPPGGAQTADRLAALGWNPVAAPCLLTAPRPARLPAPALLAAILVTSGQAVAALPASHRGVALFSVGAATAARARAAGFADVRSADGDAAALAALVVATLTPAAGTLLLASGAGQGMGLARSLRLAGFRVIRRVVYAARPATALPPHALAALAGGQVRAAMFFSAQTARVFERLLPAALRPLLAGADALAIGAEAASVLRRLPWRAVRVAVRPTQDEMFALLP
jgi:uroporphyrinogen-III synthase